MCQKGGEEREVGDYRSRKHINMMKFGTKIKKTKCENLEDTYVRMYEVTYSEEEICTAKVEFFMLSSDLSCFSL